VSILEDKLVTHIAPRKLANEFLPQSQDSLRLIIDTIPTMAWTVRPDGAVDFVNQRWLDYAGLSLEEEIEEPTRVIHPEDLPRVMEKRLRDMAAAEPSEDEIRLRRADGEYRWFLVRTVPLRDEIHDELGYALAAIKLEFTALLRELPVDKGPVGQ
jgi:PAS domain S-box-containing protein